MMSTYYISTGLSPKIIVVGHSVGGMIARTAMLLDNHPKGCPVSDIVMLSTPNLR
jgi:triacylglycerol esterase/lipase EstA (alpha/beta hydrolase family)